jgi:hypothetical protein
VISNTSLRKKNWKQGGGKNNHLFVIRSLFTTSISQPFIVRFTTHLLSVYCSIHNTFYFPFITNILSTVMIHYQFSIYSFYSFPHFTFYLLIPFSPFTKPTYFFFPISISFPLTSNLLSFITHFFYIHKSFTITFYHLHRTIYLFVHYSHNTVEYSKGCISRMF